MNKLSLLILAGLALIMTSCSVSSEATRNVNNHVTNVNLSSANYRVIGQVEGKSKQFYFLFLLGGSSPTSLSQAALSDMYEEAYRIGKGRSVAVINTSVSHKTSLFLICGMRQAFARGTLIEFIDDKSPAPAFTTNNQDVVNETKPSAPETAKTKISTKTQAETTPIVTPQSKKTYKFGKIKFKEGNPVKLQVATLDNAERTKIYGSIKLKSKFNRLTGNNLEPKESYEITLPDGNVRTFDKSEVLSVIDTTLPWSEFEKLWRK